VDGLLPAKEDEGTEAKKDRLPVLFMRRVELISGKKQKIHVIQA